MSCLAKVTFAFGFGLLVVGCAHRGGPPTTPQEIVREDVQRVRRYLGQIPGCSSEAGAVPLAELTDPSTPPPPRVRAFLVRDEGVCTQMACNHECCNKCRGDWKAAASRHGAAPVLRLAPPPSWEAMDCSLPSLKGAAAPLEVIITGTLRPHAGADGDLPGQPSASEIAYTSICGAR